MKKICMVLLLISGAALLLTLGAAMLTKRAGSQEEQPGKEETHNLAEAQDMLEEEPVVEQKLTWLTPELILPEQVAELIGKGGSTEKFDTIYDMEYQNAVEELIEARKAEDTYTLEEPLLMLNPYGTNVTGLYLYFNHDSGVRVSYEISVGEEEIRDFSEALFTNAGNLPLAEQEGQIIGLIQGKTNYITLFLTDEHGAEVARAGYRIEVPDYGTIKEPKLTMEQSGSGIGLTSGLFCLFGYDRRNEEEPRHLLFYDNDGNIRAEIPLNGSISDVNLKNVDGNLFYACSNNEFVMVNHLGKIEKIFPLGKNDYIHHDFAVIDTLNQVVVLANDLTKDTTEDQVLSLNYKTGEVEKIVDFAELMPDILKEAKKGWDGKEGEYLDWLHFNAIQVVGESDLLLSSRETSTIMRVNNVFESPELAYFIADESIWSGTAYEDLMLDKMGDFPSQTGQHSITYLPDSSLPEGQYYLYLFNNNYGEQSTYGTIDLSGVPGVGMKGKSAEYSYYYRYLVDEHSGTYELVQEFELPYSPLVSNVQHYNGNIVTCSGQAGIFEEYTGSGKLLARYFMDVELFTYRVFKYDMKGLWFAGV